jgi:hypothetical protein
VLLIVPGLFLMTIWSVVAPVMVIERPGVFASFTRSRELVRGYGWQVFGVIVVVILIAIVVAVIVGIATSGMSDTGRAIVQWVLNVITAPLSGLLVAVLYFGLIRAHGERAPSTTVGEPGPEVPGTWAPPAPPASEAPTTSQPPAPEPPTQQQPTQPPASPEPPPSSPPPPGGSTPQDR